MVTFPCFGVTNGYDPILCPERSCMYMLNMFN
ncbi:hypothetical protein VPHK251G3_0062 [Vibrio phage K251 g3]